MRDSELNSPSKQIDMFRSALKVNSFFAGIGGFDLAFEKQGFETGFYCENNEFCRSVLKRHWPEVKNSADIQNVDVSQIPLADVWTAGFPCQDLSLARTPHGKRHGLNGARSGLFYSFLELLSVHKPEVVLLENVAGLLSSHNGADFAALLASLTRLGYAVAWRVLNARYFGAPQSRPRVFICAWLRSPEYALSSLYEDNIVAKPRNERAGFMQESKCDVSGISVPQLSFCISATSGRHTGLDWARSYVTYRNAVRRLTPLECERLQGLPDNWTLPATSYAVSIRGVETNRYHAIGNAVCVPVVEWIAARIKFNFDQAKQSTKSKKRPVMEKRVTDLGKKYISVKSQVNDLNLDASGSWSWKTGGIAYRGLVITESVSSSPSVLIPSRLIDVIEKGYVPDRYYLSVNAVQGILRRVDKLGRSLYPPLDDALRRMAAMEEPAVDHASRSKEFVAS